MSHPLTNDIQIQIDDLIKDIKPIFESQNLSASEKIRVFDENVDFIEMLQPITSRSEASEFLAYFYQQIISCLESSSEMLDVVMTSVKNAFDEGYLSDQDIAQINNSVNSREPVKPNRPLR